MKLSQMTGIEVLARTLFGEARGEYGRKDVGLSGLIAVSNVIMNRVKKQSWFGKSVYEVCVKPYQFSCWNKTDPNFMKIQCVERDNSIFEVCWQVAEKAIEGELLDLTNGADHYYSTSLPLPPLWAQYAKETLHLGNHRFFKVV